MTLKNARSRFGALGCEVERDTLHGYRYRRIGTLRWRRGACPDALLVAAKQEVATL